jgi:hypothetical protein
VVVVVAVAMAMIVMAVAIVVRVVRSWQDSHQVDKGEDADPDHVQEVPEHRQAHQAAVVGGVRPCLFTWNISVTSQTIPKVTCRPWVPTSAKNEVRNRCAAAGAFVDQVHELIQFEVDEAAAQQTGDGQPDQCLRSFFFCIASMAKP